MLTVDELCGECVKYLRLVDAVSYFLFVDNPSQKPHIFGKSRVLQVQTKYKLNN